MKCLVVFFSFSLCFHAWGQDLDSELNKFAPCIRSLQSFSNNIPQETVYLHFDNTSYYQGDHIWFKCYVVTSAQHQLSQLSKTLYVELLNPGGEMIAKRMLKIENGQCHGDFTLNQLPFYSGFYEIRAYTKYMLNFGDDIIFSRLLPVFDKPKEEGNFEEKDMLRYGRYGTRHYPMKRENMEKGKTVNLRFFPEGGHLIQGVASRVAFEVTDAFGNPIEVTGVVMDERKQELCRFTTLHEGKGVFTYTPKAGKQKDVAVVEYSEKKYRFDLPEGLPEGVAMEVDNLSYPDSIGITLRKNMDTPAEMLGVAVLSGGTLQQYCFVWVEIDTISFQIDKTRLLSGVSQIVLFNSKGEILCDRLIFTNKNDFLKIKAKASQPAYQPYELVNMEFSLSDRDANPVQATFSVSVRDAANGVENEHNILTDLLLMSEIKGYVRNPSYYFEKDDTTHCAALDVLLMVQGWRRYSWKQMAGIEPFEMKCLPEQGIETKGQVISLVKQKPQPNVDVGLFLNRKKEENKDVGGFIETFVTDSLGRFSFVSGVSGRWNMILTVKEKGKKKNHRILLDRIFSPEPRKYSYTDLQISLAEKNKENANDEEIPDDQLEEDLASFFAAYEDSLAKLGIDEKVHHIPEVTIKAKRRTKEQDIFHNRSTSVAYYDIDSEMDDIYDRGNVVNNIHELIVNMNDDFSIEWNGIREFLRYKGRPIVFVVNYEQTKWDEFGYFKYRYISLSAIKSIYVNEKPSVISQYILPPPMVSSMEIALGLSCAVFIETYPDEEIPVDGAKGVRKTWLEGYSAVSEFYSPDYSALPPVSDDYRRTLYWNPAVTTNENGLAKIKFYNNSRCKNFSISAETVTSKGIIGIYNNNE